MAQDELEVEKAQDKVGKKALTLVQVGFEKAQVQLQTFLAWLAIDAAGGRG
jgi:hypothetical protein